MLGWHLRDKDIIMYIPQFYITQLVDKDGFLTSEMKLYNDELSQSLQNGLSDNGWTLPLQKTANIAAIAALPTTQLGTMWYDTDTNQFKILTNIGVQVVTVT